MLRDDAILIKHIIEAAEKAIMFLDGQTREKFAADEKLSLSIVRLLEIIGEAANQVSDEYKKAHVDVPWRDMVSLRNRLIHGYFDVDLDIVWDTVKSDLPKLLESLRKLG